MLRPYAPKPVCSRFALGFAAACLSSLSAQTPAWRAASAPQPYTVGPGAMAYDDLRDRTVFFGGGSGYVPFAGVMELDGETWVPRVPASASAAWPPPRFDPALAYDSRRGEVLMHGGNTLGPVWYTDTWRWNGSIWSQATPSTTPPAMWGHAMAYDELRDRIVLYGFETWEWDGSDWSRRTPAQEPPARSFPALAFDARRGRTLLFGGVQGGINWLADTWEWDGTSWLQVATSGLQPTAIEPVMAFDRERGRALLVGIVQGGATVAYQFDGTAWTPTTAPVAPSKPMMVYDRQRGRVVLLTRNAAQPQWSATWIHETAGLALAQPYGVACGSPALRAVEDPAARPVLGGTLGVDVTDVPAGLAFMCLGWSNRIALQFALPLPMAGFGLPGCWLLQSDDAITLPCLTTGATTARFSMAIPSHPTFVGLRFFVQPWAPAPGVFSPIDAVVGNAVAATIGSF